MAFNFENSDSYVQVLSQTTTPSEFLRSDMFRLPVGAIIREPHYYEDTGNVSYVGKW
jgi:hypothetical protein